MNNFKIGQSVEYWNDFNNRWESGWVLKGLTDTEAQISNSHASALVIKELIRSPNDALAFQTVQAPPWIIQWPPN